MYEPRGIEFNERTLGSSSHGEVVCAQHSNIRGSDLELAVGANLLVYPPRDDIYV